MVPLDSRQTRLFEQIVGLIERAAVHRARIVLAITTCTGPTSRRWT